MGEHAHITGDKMGNVHQHIYYRHLGIQKAFSIVIIVALRPFYSYVVK
jgi:hypothetical protein